VSCHCLHWMIGRPAASTHIHSSLQRSNAFVLEASRAGGHARCLWPNVAKHTSRFNLSPAGLPIPSGTESVLHAADVTLPPPC
jgi:hypothetical protein